MASVCQPRLALLRVTLLDVAAESRLVRLGDVEAPVLAVAADRDHLVPPAMARPLVDLVGSTDRQYTEFAAGHVGLVVGSGARDMLWPTVTGWLDARSD
jgi:polyhydroxyalkanoate synthase